MADGTDNKTDKRRSSRTDMEPEDIVISFMVDAGDFDISEVNVSDTGLGFATDTAIGIKVRLQYKDKGEDRLARLVWAGKNPNGGMRYGFEFIDE